MAIELTPENKAFIKTHLVDRHHTNTLKWDALDDRFGNPDLLPLWVADMEFKTAQPVRDALVKRVEEGVFGYSYIPDSYKAAFIDWQRDRHGITVKPEWLRFDTGVVNSLYGLVNWLTEPGDPVLIFQPVYYPFANAVTDTHRKLISCNLLDTPQGWQVDYEALHKIITEDKPKLVIWCSPHNPVGRIWKPEELETILTPLVANGIPVISDEIHEDFEIGEQPFTSVLDVADGRFRDGVIVVNAPSKTFNLATLLHSHVIIPNAAWRKDYDSFIKSIHQTEPSLLGVVAGEAAYRYGTAWLDQILQIIRYNDGQVRKILRQAPGVKLHPLEGTYLLYVDLGQYIPADKIRDFVQNHCHLAVDYGAWFSPQTPTFIRLNLATDPAIVARAANQIVTALQETVPAL
ncbi:MalY/PatB family protein [Schleiferilactobacillus harbinensis]|uniref:MalY/PatB family protein n=1 Tax=Schleiferilactobacillus harbinensis TaxID=304207 RepID=UPI00345E6998